MMRVIIVDDEEMAVQRLERLLGDFPEVEVAERSCDPLDLLDKVEQGLVAAELCFVDISMPGINGLDFALKLQELKPSIAVCFTTSYSEYAVQAFELNALDYLMKPIVKERLQKTLSKVIVNEVERPTGKYSLQTFGQFGLLENGQPIHGLKWRTTKAEELFALLVHQMGSNISRDRIIEILWPEMEPQKAGTNLNATTYYIRKTLSGFGLEGCIQVTKTIMQFVDQNLDIDLWQFDKLLADKEQLLSLKPGMVLKRLSLYKGPYLASKDYLWAYDKQTFMETAYTTLFKRLSEKWFVEGEYNDLETYCLQALDVVPYFEAPYEMLIKLYIKNRNFIRAKDVYNQYERLLKDELGIEMPKMIHTMMAPYL